MTVFDTLAATIAADTNLALDALYRAGGAGAGVAVRVLLRAPDQTGNFGDSRFLTSSSLMEIRTIDAPDFAVGDTIETVAGIYTVRGDPRRDVDRLFWTAEVKEP